MKQTALALSFSAALAAAACSTAAEPPVVTIVPGQAFSLAVGAGAQPAGGAWRITFDGVVSDSRCPKGERCVWAGDAVARFRLQPAGGAGQVVDLHTAPNAAQQVQAFGVALQLVGLEPYPVTGRAIATADYRATLVLQTGPAAATDR